MSTRPCPYVVLLTSPQPPLLPSETMSVAPQPRRHSPLVPSPSRNSNTAFNLLTSILGTSPVSPALPSTPASFSSPPPNASAPPPYTPSPPPTVLATLPYMERAFMERLSRSGINLPALQLSQEEVEETSARVIPPSYVPPPPLFRHRATAAARFPRSQPTSRRGSIGDGNGGEGGEESEGGGGAGRTESLSFRERARAILVGEVDPSPLLPPVPPTPSTDPSTTLSTQTPPPVQQSHPFAASLPSLSLPLPQPHSQPNPNPTTSSSSSPVRRPHSPQRIESYTNRARRLLRSQPSRPPSPAAEEAARREFERESEERMERMRRRSEGDEQRSQRDASGSESRNGRAEAAVSYAERARRMLVQREVRLRGFDEEGMRVRIGV